MQWWQAMAVTSAVTTLAYIGISAAIVSGIAVDGQWRRNPLAAATAAIFFTCAVHHGSHALYLVLPSFEIAEGHGLALREAFSDWHMLSWDAVAAAVAVWYWTLRSRFPALVRGAAVFEDLRQRQHHALQLNDDVVQRLAAAKLHFEFGDVDAGMRSLEDGLDRAKAIITELLGEGEPNIGPGVLRRDAPTSPSSPT